MRLAPRYAGRYTSPARALSSTAIPFSSVVPATVGVLGTVAVIAGAAFSVGSYYHAEIARLDGVIAALRAEMKGDTSRLEANLAGVVNTSNAELKSMKEVVKEVTDVKLAFYKEVSDLKVRVQRNRPRALIAATPSHFAPAPHRPAFNCSTSASGSPSRCPRKSPRRARRRGPSENGDAVLRSCFDTCCTVSAGVASTLRLVWLPILPGGLPSRARPCCGLPSPSACR